MIDPKLAKTVNLLAEPTSIIEAFDPALGKSIDHEYIISQAQERLKGRSQDELEAGTRYAAELLRQAEASAKSSALKQMQAGTNQVYLNDPLAFIELFERFELDKREDFSDAEPITYFSLIALNFALESLDASRRAGDPSGNPSKDPMEQAVREHAKRFVQERANDAKELLAFTHGMEFEGIFRRKTASKAGQTRQAQFDPLKEKDPPIQRRALR